VDGREEGILEFSLVYAMFVKVLFLCSTEYCPCDLQHTWVRVRQRQIAHAKPFAPWIVESRDGCWIFCSL
jgi:hypothetical protein